MIIREKLDIKCMQSKIIICSASLPKHASKSILEDFFTSTSFFPIIFMMMGSDRRWEKRHVEIGSLIVPNPFKACIRSSWDDGNRLLVETDWTARIRSYVFFSKDSRLFFQKNTRWVFNMSRKLRRDWSWSMSVFWYSYSLEKSAVVSFMKLGIVLTNVVIDVWTGRFATREMLLRNASGLENWNGGEQSTKPRDLLIVDCEENCSNRR